MDEGIREFARNTFADDLKSMDAVPGNLYNFHTGSHVKQGADVGIQLITEMLNDLLWEDMNTTVLLESMAGKGSEVGRNFEELRQIIDGVKLNDKLGICMDTCHLWDGGYDIVNDLDGVLAEFDQVIGLERLKAIHLNDSKNVCGAHKDRHEKIGEGFFGIAAIGRIINHEKLRHLPFYLETPNELEGYGEEIKLLRGLYQPW